jgi:hypothetical protein
MTPDVLRAWNAHRQGLDGRLLGNPASEILTETGWVRSVGGATPYLALHARGGLSRSEIDAAVADASIHELPSARGCTYVVPQADYAVALAAGRAFNGVTERRTAEKLGVSRSEIESLNQAVLSALAGGALDPRALHQATDGAARNLGDEGRKRGLTTTLPVALGELQSAGRIRRVPVDGRLDQQRYAYALWEPGPFAAGAPTEEEAYAELARRFFRWASPATLADFQWFAGLSQRAARAAVADLGLVELAPDDPRMLLTDDLDALRAFRPPATPQYVLVGSLDNIGHLRRDGRALLEASDLASLDSGTLPGETPGNLADLPHHAILDRGRLVGFWDYDPEAGVIVWAAFGPVDEELRASVARTESFVRDELGDARSFSLDSPASRRGRLEALAAVAA